MATDKKLNLDIPFKTICSMLLKSLILC